MTKKPWEKFKDITRKVTSNLFDRSDNRKQRYSSTPDKNQKNKLIKAAINQANKLPPTRENSLYPKPQTRTIEEEIKRLPEVPNTPEIQKQRNDYELKKQINMLPEVPNTDISPKSIKKPSSTIEKHIKNIAKRAQQQQNNIKKVKEYLDSLKYKGARGPTRGPNPRRNNDINLP